MYKKGTHGLSKYINLMLADELCLVISFVLAYMIRHGLRNPFASSGYINMVIVFTMINIILMAFTNFLSNVRKRGYLKEMTATISHVVLLELIGAFYLFSTKTGRDYSRITIYLFGILYIFISYCGRLLWKAHRRRRAPAAEMSSLFIIASSDRAERAVQNLKDGIEQNRFQILGMCITDKDCIGHTIGGIKVNTTIDNYAEFLCREWCDEVYVSLDKSLPYTQTVIDKLVEMGIVIHFEIEDFSHRHYPHQIVEKFESEDVITISLNMATAQQLFIKRALDILAGIVGCLITLILTVILGPLIWIQSPGPIFFTQTRIGQNGKKFKIYKFRSMYMDAEKRKQELMAQNRIQDGMMFKMEHDPRIIGCKIRPDGTVKKGIGNFIRDFSLDEFPQFFNVLIGNMSLCGTRPPTQDEWNKYELHHRARLAIKPGITGMWQTSGRSEITDFEEVVRLDKEYIENWSLSLDLKLIFKTILVVFKKEGSM